MDNTEEMLALSQEITAAWREVNQAMVVIQDLIDRIEAREPPEEVVRDFLEAVQPLTGGPRWPATPRA